MSTQDSTIHAGSAAQKPITIPPMSIQQEGLCSSSLSQSYTLNLPSPDNIIHTRITNDEKALRRVAKKFHSYTAVAYNPVVPSSAAVTSVEDAREAFLIELASFHLSLKKSLMVCEAEVRQVEEYQRERGRIGKYCNAVAIMNNALIPVNRKRTCTTEGPD